jgi:hypothetical protein
VTDFLVTAAFRAIRMVVVLLLLFGALGMTNATHGATGASACGCLVWTYGNGPAFTVSPPAGYVVLP